MKSRTNLPLLIQSLCISAALLPTNLPAQSVLPADASPLVLTLQSALLRARQYGSQIQAANVLVELAKEDRVQARAAALPSLSALNQFIYTEGNGTPSGVFVANDGVHVYNEQAWVHQELLSVVRRGELRMAHAAEAVARAKADVARRGLNQTVVQDFYAIAAAQRHVTNALTALKDAQQFLDISRKQEVAGEAAHVDVIKAQLQTAQRQRDQQDALITLEKSKINLGVLIFPSLSIDYSVADDLADVPPLPDLTQFGMQAKAANPDLTAAQAAVGQARLGVSVARYAYLPSFALDFWYGIDANQFAAQATGQSTGRSTLPNYLVENRQNLGYSAEASLTIPVWNWGSIRSRVKQADLKRQQAEADLSVAQRQAQADVTTAAEEARTAFAQIELLQSSADLANEGLRLTLLRYQAGEATAFEVTDAQTTASQARNAYDDGLARYRIALESLHNLTGAL